MHKTSDLLSRNQILGRLVQQFESQSSGVVTEVNYLAEQLTSEELAGSTDTIAIYKVRSKYKEGKYIEAYSILQDALQSDPFNICLQAERTTFLNGVAYRIFELIKEEPHSALIDQLYKILEQEGAASAGHLIGYLNSLIIQKRWKEATAHILPLIELCPEILQVDLLAEEVTKAAPHPEVIKYLNRPKARHASVWKSIDLSASDAFEVSNLTQLLDKKASANLLEAKDLVEINRTISRYSNGDVFIANFKSLYFFKALILKDQGEYQDAVFLLDSLVSFDPCRVEFRRMRDQAIYAFCGKLIELAEASDYNYSISQFYPLLREMGHISFVFLKAVCIQEARKGRSAEAKHKMKALVSLNPLDFDYVSAASEVAEVLDDQQWLAELKELKVKMLKTRPWDLEVRNDFEKQSGE